MPGVSMKTICASGRLTTPWMVVRVVCGFSETMASFSPARAFKSVDLPAFGRPIIEANPDRNSLITVAHSLMSLRHGFLRHFRDPHLLYLQLVASQDFQADPIPLDHFADV